jgi:hypothetical protein
VPWALRTEVDCPFPVIDLPQVPALRGPERLVHLVAAWWRRRHLHARFRDRVVRTDNTCMMMMPCDGLLCAHKTYAVEYSKSRVDYIQCVGTQLGLVRIALGSLVSCLHVPIASDTVLFFTKPSQTW